MTRSGSRCRSQQACILRTSWQQGRRCLHLLCDSVCEASGRPLHLLTMAECAVASVLCKGLRVALLQLLTRSAGLVTHRAELFDTIASCFERQRVRRARSQPEERERLLDRRPTRSEVLPLAPAQRVSIS